MREWLDFMLHSGAFSAGQLQYGYTIQRPHKTVDSHNNEKIIMRTERVQGTRIPAFVMQKFIDGLWTPREKSIRRLAAMYRRWAYNHMKQSGANKYDANKFSRRKPKAVLDAATAMQGHVKKTAQRRYEQDRNELESRGVSYSEFEHYIEWGYGHSDYDLDDWENQLTSPRAKK